MAALARSLETAVHPVFGRYISAITVGRRIPMNPVDLFTAYVYEAPAQTVATTRSATDWDVVMTTPDASLTLFTATLKVDPVVRVVLSVTKEAQGFAFRLVEARGSGQRAVSGVDFPRLLIPPFTTSPETFYGLSPFTTGFVERKPHMGGSFVAGTDQCQFRALWDSVTQDCVYLWSDDVAMSAKLYGGFGDGTAVLLNYLHLADRRYATGLTWSRPYAVRFEIFKGQARHGALVGYEAALRYRNWAANAARPWRNRGRWADSPAVGSFTKNLDLHVSFTGAKHFERWRLDLPRWLSECGFTAPLLNVYDYKNPAGYAEPFTPDPAHAGAVSPDVTSFLADLRAQGWRTSVYVLARFQDTRNRDGWRADQWASAHGLPADLSAYLLKTRSGAPKVAPVMDAYGQGGWYLMDFAAATALADYARDLVVRIRNEIGLGGPDWFYVDAMGALLPTDPANDPDGAQALDFQDDPAAVNWTYGALAAGKRTFLETTRTTLASGGRDGGVYTEWPAEPLVSAVDLTPHNDGFGHQGAWAALMHLVHSDVCRFSGAFGTPAIVRNHPDQAAYLCVLSTVSWLRSGVFAFNDGLDLDPNNPRIFSDPVENSPLYFWIKWAGKLRAMLPACRPYFEGRMYRPLVVDWRAQLFENATPGAPGWETWVATHGPDALVSSETWKHVNGSLGVMVAYSFPDAAAIVPPWTDLVPILPPVTREVSFNATRDELPSGQKEVFRTTNNGPRTKIGQFSSTFSATLEFAPWTVTLIECVKKV
ncbi:MAG TPA: hypothetical protein VEI02_04590 [Planctomycetota bacterium]|nr:hypothetical protein [Planctomycetota bacterium]